MANVYRRKQTLRVPAGAERFRRGGKDCARWKDARGRVVTGEVYRSASGEERITIRSQYYYAKYRDADGLIRNESTECTSLDAARHVLAEIERREELRRSGLLSDLELEREQHAVRPVAEHVKEYESSMRARGLHPGRIQTTERRLQKLLAECGWRNLTDLSPASLERWLSLRAEEGMGASTRNGWRGAAVAFASWCLKTRRLAENPFVSVQKAREEQDRRREGCALSLDELRRLVEAAERRPVNHAPEKASELTLEKLRLLDSSAVCTTNLLSTPGCGSAK